MNKKLGINVTLIIGILVFTIVAGYSFFNRQMTIPTTLLTPTTTPITNQTTSLSPTLTTISPVNGVTIQSVVPDFGPVNTQAVITGVGFTREGNWVIFTGKDTAIIRNIESKDTVTLSFKIPEQFNPCSPFLDKPCNMGSYIRVGVGNYNVSVQNKNGTSNSVIFAVSK